MSELQSVGNENNGKMEVKYISHSGFTVEMEKVILLFDYYKGAIPKLPKEKEFYVFSSHFHKDHFNIKMFQLLEKYEKVTYILSYDIRKQFNKKFFLRHGVSEDIYDRIIFIKPDETQQIGQIEVHTLKSTDEGVAFLIRAEEKTIYHAGDLQSWTWLEETQEEQEQMRHAYQSELAKIEGREIDLAFLVLDPRQRETMPEGFDYFMRHTDTKLAYAMHFWGKYSVIRQLKEMELSAPYRDRVADRELYGSRANTFYQ